jgi:flagellar biosynthesis/type III secretory pathway M-ring protein FliF/YscJ
MAGALILTILPVMLIVTVLFMVSGNLGPLAAVGLAAFLALVATVFFALLRSARRQQPSRAHGDPRRSEDPSEQEEEERERAEGAARLGEEIRAGEVARDVRRAEDALARWDNEGGSARP